MRIKKELKKKASSTSVFAQSLIFHLIAAVLFAFILLLNSGTYRSLQKIDPDGAKAQTIEQKFKKRVEQIRVYFKPTASPSNKGGIP